MDLARDLGNLPANLCTPAYLGERAQALAQELGFKCEVLERAQIEELKMGSFLSVTNGSDQPPRFIVLEYNGGRQEAGRWCWWARASPSTPAAFRSSPRSTWIT